MQPEIDGQKLISDECDAIKVVLLAKNRRYGNSALKPKRVFSKADPIEQLNVRLDDVDPKSKGGKDDINNLVTACFDCNRGKKAIPLTKIPPKLSENLEVLQKQEAQIKEYRKFIRKIELRVQKDMNAVDAVYREAYPGWQLSDLFRLGTLKQFINKLPLPEIVSAMEIAVSRVPQDKDRVIKYFCGICWNKIKSLTDPNHEIKRELVRYWESRPRGSGYLPKGGLDRWLSEYTPEQIRNAMTEANGICATLRSLLG